MIKIIERSAMKTARILILLFFAQLIIFTPILLANGKATDTVSSQVRCAVCGMFVAKYPDWLAQIHYDDPGQTRFFDGVKDMMVFYFDPERYEGPPREAIKNIYVKDYYSLNWLSQKMLFTFMAVMFTDPWVMNLFHLNLKRLQNLSRKTITVKKFLLSVKLHPGLLIRCAWARECDNDGRGIFSF